MMRHYYAARCATYVDTLLRYDAADIRASVYALPALSLRLSRYCHAYARLLKRRYAAVICAREDSAYYR